ncbi:hypothetical protein [Thermocatellispora tengchongensis]|uniref:hypothetical protein n=1 Tax=Thermocatellispora tengchongensis TaxID=1073253 RepID=UPI00363EF9CD
MTPPRVALLISHFSPVSRSAPSVSSTVTSPASRSLPCARSVRPQDTGTPASTHRATSSWISGPPNHAETAPRNVLPCPMATVRSRRAMARSRCSPCSSVRSAPPHSAGT